MKLIHLAGAITTGALTATATMALAQTPSDERQPVLQKPVNEPGVVHRLPLPPRPAEGSTPGATVNVTLVTNGPVPDTPENRERFGKPRSQAGRNTKPAGN